jgi:hypothetical protein
MLYVLLEAAEAMLDRFDYFRQLADAHSFAIELVDAYVGRHPGQTCLIFDCGEIGRIAAQINRWLPDLTYVKKEFFLDDAPLPIELLIRAFLNQSMIWDPVREQHVPTNNRLVGEIRAALMQSPRVVRAEHPRTGDKGTGPLIDAVALPPSGSTFAACMSECFMFRDMGWEAKETLMRDQAAWHAGRGMPPKTRVAFFRELKKLAGGRIRESHRNGKPGYAGIESRNDIPF